MKNPSHVHTFVCRLGDGSGVSLRVDFAQLRTLPANKMPAALRFTWHGLRTAHHFPKYRAWSIGAWQAIADATGTRTLFVITGPNKIPEGIACIPGNCPEGHSPPCR